MKKQKTERLIGRINPFSRTWLAIKKTVNFNLMTLVLVALANLGLAAIVAIAAILALAGMFVIALSIPAVNDFITQTATFFQVQLPQLGFALFPAILLALVMPLLVVAIASFMAALIQKTLLSSMHESKIRFREVFQTAMRKLPRVWLLSLIEVGVNLLIVAAIATLVMLISGTVSATQNIAFMVVTAVAGILALCALLIVINLRWFLYSWFIIIDTDQKVLPALRLSKDHFARAPGYTIALLLIAFAVGGVFSLVADIIGRIEGAQVVNALVSFVGSIFTLSILTLGYLDIKAAAKEQTYLRTKRGMFALAVVVFVLAAIVSGSAQPKQESTPFTWPEQTAPEGDFGIPIDQS